MKAFCRSELQRLKFSLRRKSLVSSLLEELLEVFEVWEVGVCMGWLTERRKVDGVVLIVLFWFVLVVLLIGGGRVGGS